MEEEVCFFAKHGSDCFDVFPKLRLKFVLCKFVLPKILTRRKTDFALATERLFVTQSVFHKSNVTDL